MLPRNKKLARPAPDGGDQGGVKNKNDKGKGNGKNKGSGGFYGARGGYKGVSKRRVNRLVGGVIRDEVRDLRHERKGVRREFGRNKRDIGRSYSRGNKDLRHIYGETEDYLGDLANRQQQQVSNQSNQITAAQQALQQQLGNTYTGAADQANSELSRLGIEGGGNLGGLISDQANAQAMGAQAGANAQSTLGLMGGNAQQMMGLLQGMNQGSMMSNAGLNLQRRNDALIEARGNRDENMQAIRSAIRDVRGGRRDLFFQMLNQLQETGWGQYMDQQQLNMARRELNDRLGKNKKNK